MKIHITAFAIILPLILIVTEGNPVINLIGLVYALILYRLSKTPAGKQFICRYYREVLRLESLL